MIHAQQSHDTCATSATDLLLRSTISDYVAGTAGNGIANVEDVTTAYQYDAYGQQTRTTRSNYTAAGTLLDSVAGGSTYDERGGLTSSIANYSNGTVTDPGDDMNRLGFVEALAVSVAARRRVLTLSHVLSDR